MKKPVLLGSAWATVLGLLGLGLALGVSLMSGSAQARVGGDEVNNGGGASEHTIVFAFSKIDKYIELCLHSDSCKIDDRQKMILNQILTGIPKERQFTNPIIFMSEKQNPGTFIIDGEVKVAKTGLEIGTPIYFNVDLLYRQNAAGVYQAIQLSDAIAFLTHELGHHYGDYTHTELDFLGVKVSLLFQQEVYTTPLLPTNQNISSTIINDKSGKGFPDVFLNVYDDMIDVSQAFADAVSCDVNVPIPFLPIPDITIHRSRPLAALFNNIHWDKVDEKDRFRIIGNLSNVCKANSTFDENNNDNTASIEFGLKNANPDPHGVPQWEYDPATLIVKQMYDPWYKVIKLSFLNF